MGSSLRALHVLAYDDDRAIRLIYAELLGEEGYRVTLAAEPLADPAAVAAVGADLVIVDLMAGDEDHGTPFLARLRQHPATRDLPVLICSGDRAWLVGMQDQVREWGCAVITKPFDIDVFLAAVASCLAGGASRWGSTHDAERAAD